MASKDINADENDAMEQLIEIKQEQIEIDDTWNEGCFNFKSDGDTVYQDEQNDNYNHAPSDLVCSGISYLSAILPSDRDNAAETVSFGCKDVQNPTHVKEESTDSKGNIVRLTVYLNENHKYAMDNYQSSHENISKNRDMKPNKNAYELVAGTWDTPYKCEMCGYECSNSRNIKAHIRIHTGEKPYNCQMCEYKCTQSCVLRRHERTHTGDKPYKCKICEYKSAQSSAFKLHIRKHSGEKPYKCRVCEYRCTGSSNLKIHMRTHSGEKPYSCKMCEYRTTQSSTLKVHIRKHTGEKPYKCETCEFGCTTSSYLKRHIKIHTLQKS